MVNASTSDDRGARSTDEIATDASMRPQGDNGPDAGQFGAPIPGIKSHASVKIEELIKLAWTIDLWELVRSATKDKIGAATEEISRDMSRRIPI